LDALVEELEETKKETVYDDYKFVTRNELEELGLSHLIGKCIFNFVELKLMKHKHQKYVDYFRNKLVKSIYAWIFCGY